MKPSVSRSLRRFLLSSTSAIFIFGQGGLLTATALTATTISSSAKAADVDSANADVDSALSSQESLIMGRPGAPSAPSPAPYHPPAPAPHPQPPPAPHPQPPPAPHPQPLPAPHPQPPPAPHPQPPPAPHPQPPPAPAPHPQPPPAPHPQPPPAPHPQPPPAPHPQPPPAPAPAPHPVPHPQPPPVQPPHPHPHPQPPPPPHPVPKPPPHSHPVPPMPYPVDPPMHHHPHPPVPPPHHIPPHPLPPVCHPPHHWHHRPVYYPVPYCDLHYWSYYCRPHGVIWYPYPFPERPLPPLPPPVVYPAPAPSPQWESVRVVINQDVVDHAEFDLVTLAGLDQRRYSGAVVDSVDVSLAPQEDGVGVALVTDGTTADAENSARENVRLVPHSGAQLGNDLSSMSLEIGGSVHVNEVVINLLVNDDDYTTYDYNNDVILSQDVAMDVADQGTLDIADMIDLYNYQGYHVVSVTVQTQSAQDQFSVVRFFANDVEQDRALTGTQSGTQTFFVSGANQLGNDLLSLKLSADGALTVQNLEIRLAPDQN